MITVNGKPVEGFEGKTVANILESEGFDTSRIVVEKNLEIITRDMYDKTLLSDNDKLEVLSFVGGG